MNACLKGVLISGYVLTKSDTCVKQVPPVFFTMLLPFTL